MTDCVIQQKIEAGRGRNASSFRRIAGYASALACLAMVTASPVAAQGNDDDYTPLGSRIKRDRQFPLDVPMRWGRDQQSAANRARSKSMISQFGGCLYERDKTSSLDLLQKTDPSFVDFAQIKMDPDRALRIFGFQDCIERVADANSSGVSLRFAPGSLRQWLLQQAYFDRYRNGPDWVKPGNVITDRTYVLPSPAGGIRMAMDFADCVVASDPNGADYYFRAAADSPAERDALKGLMPVLGPCFPAGRSISLQPAALRSWLGEALWYASNNNAPAPADASPSKVAQ